MRLEPFSLPRRSALFLGGALAAPAIPSRAQQAEPLAPLAPVSASRIAAISDGDFLASTFADGALPPFGETTDMLTLFTRDGAGFSRAALGVPNSAAASPEILAASQDGRTFYVAESLVQARPEDRRAADLAPGQTLTIIRPEPRSALVATRPVPAGPEALALSPDGQWLAIVSNMPGQSSLTILPLRDGVPGEPALYGHAALGFTPEGAGPRDGVKLTNVQWRPDSRAIALNDAAGGRVAFLRFEAGVLTPWGAPVAAGTDPFTGRFAPGGRFYLTCERGRDFSAAMPEGRMPTRPGLLGITRLEEDGRHHRIAEVPTDFNPEGLAVSPDGRLVATANRRGTALAGPGFAREASVSLLAFDPESGACRKLQDVPLEVVLPRGASFDATGSHLLVTVFEGHEGQADQSGLAIFRVGQQQLVPAGRVPLPHGAHQVVVCA